MRRAGAWMLAAALLFGAPAAEPADPTESDADAVRDPDYAAGREAIERKDWSEAAPGGAAAHLPAPL